MSPAPQRRASGSRLKLPELDPVTGFYPTLNRMGGMSPTLDDFSQAFVDFATEHPKLDVGACYGLVTQAALDRGATVWANDLEPAHLEALAPSERLRLVPGRFPEDIPWEPLGAVLLARVLHYLEGERIEAGLRAIAQALVPGGKVFGVAVTPFLVKLKPFQPEYAARKAAGQRWPGIVDAARFDPARETTQATWLHLLDAEVLGRALEDAGLTVERLDYFSRAAHLAGMACDGRETLGFVARNDK